jgi:hypothetical protein
MVAGSKTGRPIRNCILAKALFTILSLRRRLFAVRMCSETVNLRTAKPRPSYKTVLQHEICGLILHFSAFEPSQLVFWLDSQDLAKSVRT